MDERELQRWRTERLKQAVDMVAAGNVTAFGRKLGYRDGAFVRQMLSSARNVSEKTVRAIEAMPDMAGWFTPGSDTSTDQDKKNTAQTHTPLTYPANNPEKYRRIYVVGRGQGGLPDRIWTDGDYPVGATDQYGELASPDPHAFLVPVVGNSMVPRFNPGEFALVEPGTEAEIEDCVLVRLTTGETMIKRLLSRRAGIRLGSYNDVTVLTYTEEQITWMYYIAHPVPARKIKVRM